MAGVEIAEAYVTLLPSMRGMGKRIESEMSGIADQSARSFSTKFSDGLRKWGKRGLIAVGGLIGGAITAGINRSMKIEDAEGKLRGLGHTGENISKIMDNALASVKGTAFGLDEAATSAASAVAAGIKPGKELQRYLTLVGDAATIAGTSLGDMGYIFNQVQSTGRAYTQELNMLAERGIPIFQWLQEEYGVTQEELRKMVSAGKVDAETFYKVIEENIGGAAQESGNTTRGALANLRAAYARFGQALVSSIFPMIREGAVALTGWIDGVTTKVQGAIELLSTGDFTADIGKKLGVEEDSPIVGGLLKVRDILSGIRDAAAEIPGVFTKAFEAAKLIFTGDYTESFREAFGMDEDHPFVRFLFRARSALLGLGEVFGKVGELGSALFKLFTQQGTGALANLLGVKQDHPLIRLLQDVRDFATDTIPAAFARVGDAIFGTFQILRGGPTGLLAQALGVDQSHFLVQGLVAIRDTAAVALTWIRDVGIPIVIDFAYWLGEKLAGAAAWLAPHIEKIGDWVVENKEHWPALAAGIAAGAAAFLGWNQAIGILKGVAAAWGLLSKAFALSPLGWVAISIGAVVAGLVLLWQNSETFRDIVTGAFEKVKEVAGDLWENTLKPFFDGLWTTITEDVIPAIQDFWENSIKPVFTEIGAIISDAWENKIAPALGNFWTMIQEDIIPAVQNLWENVIQPAFAFIGETIMMAWENAIGPALTALVDFVMNSLIPAILWLWTNVIGPVFGKIVDFIVAAWENFISPALTALRDFIFNTLIPAVIGLWENAVRPAFDGITAAIQWAWDNVIGPVFNWFADWITKTLIPFLGDLQETAETVWDAISGAIEWAWENIISPTFDAIKEGAGWVADKFGEVVEMIGNAWEWIKGFLSKPIVAVIEFINDNFINGINTILGWISDDLKIPAIPIPTFLQPSKVSLPGHLKGASGAGRGGAKGMVMAAAGGILPGWSPGKDDYFFLGEKFNLALAGGEAIMRPEWTKAVGPGFVDTMNAIARTRGVQGVREAMGFSRGGVFGDRQGGWLESLVDAAKGVGNFLSSPLEFLKDLFMRGIEALSSNPFFEWLKGAAGKIAGFAKDKILSLLGLGGEDDSNVPRKSVPGGVMTSEQIYALAKALDPRAAMTSGRRKTKLTRSGFLSYHYLGRAADLVSPDMMALFEALRATGLPWSELYYSPARGRQMRNGRPYNTYGTPAWRDHFDHIHAAMARGGIFTGLYDEGGYLPPGLSLVANETGKPEPVLTGDQWESLINDRRGDTFILHGVPMDHAGEVAATINYEIRRTRRGKYARRG